MADTNNQITPIEEDIKEEVITTEPTQQEVVTPVIEEPIIEGPIVAEEVTVPEPTPVATPIVEAPIVGPEVSVTPTVTPTKPTTEKVETAEEVKIKQLDIQEKEDAQISIKQEKDINAFNEALRAGNLDGVKDIATRNPALKSVFESSIRTILGDKANQEFFVKFNGSTNNEMKAAIDDGSMVIGSKQYNTLPEAQRRRFEQFNKLNASKRTDFTNDNTNVISLEGFVTDLQGLFSFDLRSKIEAKQNDPRLSETRSALEGLQNDISEIDDALEGLEEDIEKQFPGLPRSFILAEKARSSKDLIRSKNSLTSQYNSKLGTYRDMKSDLDLELDIAKFEDSQQKQIFNTALSMYNQRRGEMREDEKIDFLQKSKVLGEQRNLSNQKSLLEFKSKLDSEKITGEWKTLQDGLYFLTKDGKSTKVLGGDKVNETVRNKQRISEFKNDDGTITVSITDEITGDNTVYTKDITGNIIYNNGVALNGTDMRSLQNKYPGQAWAKNNNSSGITFGAASKQLQGEWAEAGIAFSKGSARPKAEGGNYVGFPTIQDGLAAHAITLGRKRSSIQDGLASWVGTPNRATNLAYAEDLYAESGITKPISTPLNKLSETELYSLMKAQIKRESPGLYSEMRQKGWMGDDRFNIPVKVEETETNTPSTSNLLSVILPAKSTELTKKSLTFGSRMADSTSNIIELEKKFSERSTTGQLFQKWAPNQFKSSDQQLLETYKQNFITASLRLESGAAIADTEFDREEIKFFPVAGDTQETIIAKQKQRELSIQLMLGAAGRDEKGVLVRDYYTPNNIDELWSTTGTTGNSNSVPDEYMKSKGIQVIQSDSTIDAIWNTGGESIDARNTGVGTLISNG